MKASLGLLVPLIALVPASLTFACSSDGPVRRGSDGSGGGGGTGGSVVIDNDAGVHVPACASGECTDFPASPLIESGAPDNAATLFGDPSAGSGTGPCVLEPQEGTLLPRNWWRPRFRFTPAAGEDLFEIRLSHSSQKNELVVYTKQTAWLLPKEIWAGLAAHATGNEPVMVSIRGLNGNAPGTPTKSQSSLTIAPVDAGGSLVYWATTSVADDGQSSKLVGFAVGEEGTVDALTIPEVQESNLWLEDLSTLKPARGAAGQGRVSCIGCHTSTPDGKAVAFNDGWPWAGIMASVEEGTTGQRPTYVTDVGARSIQQPFIGAFTFSKALWGDANRVAVATYSDPSTGVGWTGVTRNIVTRNELAWFNLAAPGSVPTDGAGMNTTITGLQNTAWGFIQRTGDARAAANPDWSHDGTKIAYTSTQQAAGGHNGGISATDGKTPLTTPTESDIFVVPFNNKAGGAATGVAGASQAGVAEYYPDFSADDQFIAFNRVNTTIGYFYYRPDGEVNVVPAAGGQAVRLAANDPPMCSGESSPGIINSWPKWSPFVETAQDGTKYYWLIFSSARKYPEQHNLSPDMWTPTGMDMRTSQLYLAAMTVTGTEVKTYPAVYIWNQTTNTSNLTPAWDDFKIPPVVVR